MSVANLRARLDDQPGMPGVFRLPGFPKDPGSLCGYYFVVMWSFVSNACTLKPQYNNLYIMYP